MKSGMSRLYIERIDTKTFALIKPFVSSALRQLCATPRAIVQEYEAGPAIEDRNSNFIELLYMLERDVRLVHSVPHLVTAELH